MADSLRRLVNIGTFNVLQEKLERWLDNYYLNTCDQNVARGCEIIELNSKVQGQLFKLLSVCAQDGGMYGGASVIKSRLLPFLGQNFFTSGSTNDTSLSVIAEATAKNREIDEIQDQYEESLRDVESDLRARELENQDLRDELAETKDQVNRSSRTASTDKLFLENENRELRRKLASAEDELRNLRSKAGILSDYDIQVRRLREDIALLTGRRDALLRSSTTSRDELQSYRPSTPSKYKPEEPPLSGLADAQDELIRLRAKSNLVDDLERQVRQLKNEMYIATSKPSYLTSDTLDSLSKYRYTPRVSSPLSYSDPVQRVRESNLIARWNDLFSQDRLDAMDTLRQYCSEHDKCQRIIFEAVKESFNVAKTAFRQFKMKVRSNLAITHVGPETLEEAVQDYINRNVDLYDAPGMVGDVIRKLDVNPNITVESSWDYPKFLSFDIIQPFIRECVKAVWQMSALAHPLDIAVSSLAELYDDTKYRRSYDSEYTAPLVDHHIWPCLSQGHNVRMKGECCTRRGASLSRSSRSPTRSRSVSPGPRSRSRSRSQSPTRRSRSPSPRRSGFQKTLNGQGTVSLWDVIRKLNVNPNLGLCNTFAVIQPFIRECVKAAWQMSALAHPLDIAVSSLAELYDDTKYRRSFDSEYTAPLVDHHIWPCLSQGPSVRMKGECCTKRGASLSGRSRSPTRSRSMSPGPRSRSRSRSQSPTRRSRSPSPRRSGFQKVY